MENWKAHNEVRDWLLASGHSITYDWTTHGAVFSHGLEVVTQVAINELQGVWDADAVVVLWPGGRGTHVELGAALALRVPVFLMSDIEAHHQATKETCAFYHHPLVTLSLSLAELCADLSEYHARTCP